jgi:putative ABC transport system permease protein
MFTLRLAFKNLLRAKRRALLSSAAIVLGVFYLIVGQSFILGSDEGAIYGVINGLTGHLTIRPADYPTEGMDHPVDELLTVTPELRAWLDKNATAWTERTLFVATVTSGTESMRMRAVGYDPLRDPTVFSRATWTQDQPMPKSAADGVMLTNGTAALLGVDVGDSIVLQARTHNGALNAISVPVAAVSRTANMIFDNAGIFVPDALVKEFLRTDGPTHVSMLLPDRDTAAKKGGEVLALLGGDASVVDWWSDCRELVEISAVRRNALNVLVGMLLLMSSMAIANTILMAAHERTREIGTLRALGMSRGGVLALFLAEGSLLGTVAGSIGAVMGGAMAWYLSHNPVDMNALKGEAMGTDIQYSAYIYGAFNLQLILVPLLVAVLVALVASIYPARLASLMEPADVVRAE